jgi:hypothetical protein
MLWLTEDAVLVCKHENGRVHVAAVQNIVTIAGRSVLVESDPEKRPITGCPNVGAAIKPCMLTLAATEGYSDFVRVDGRRVCLETITGLTDGTPPGVVKYKVHSPGQDFVKETK